jgi:nuclear GTP-binding protein
MFKSGKAQRNASGDITKAAAYQSRETPQARIEPNRKWFGNTRVISQEALSSFRDAVAERASDPYQVLLKTNKLPMSLIRDGQGLNGLKQHPAKIAVEAAPFSETFGPKAQRKRVKLSVGTIEDLAGEADKMHDTYLERLDQAKLLSGKSGETAGDTDDDKPVTTAREAVFSKGQSKRIWNELYKVMDSSDVIIHVLDARDPEGTRCRSVEKYLREEAPHKHLVFVLNKCDLVPTGVAVSLNSPRHPRFHFFLFQVPSHRQDSFLCTHHAAIFSGRLSVTALADRSCPPPGPHLGAPGSLALVLRALY